MNVPETADASAELATPVYEAYAQLVKMLLPSSGCLAIYAVDGDMAWCSDGFERPDFRELVDDFRNRNQGLEPNQGVVRETSAGVTALIAPLGDAEGQALGFVLIELGPMHSNSGKSMAASMTRPLMRCLASQLALERPSDVVTAEPTEPAEVPAGNESARLEFLLGIGQIDLNSPRAIQSLLECCVDRLDCLSAVFCIPDLDFTAIAEGAADAETRAQLGGTRRHLLAWVQLNNKPMVVNRVDSVKAPYKILSCPVVDRGGRPKGLIALFRRSESPDFELDDVRLIEFLGRQGMALLTERQDSGTGLLSRPAFERLLDDALDDGKRTLAGSLIYLDIDDLKSINESFGHAAGDEAILRAAQLIRRSLTPDEIACRLSADRFVAWLPERELASANALGAELVTAAEALGYASGGQRVPLSLRFGVAAAPSRVTRARHWIAAAELACQRARAVSGANPYNGARATGEGNQASSGARR